MKLISFFILISLFLKKEQRQEFIRYLIKIFDTFFQKDFLFKIIIAIF